MKIEITIAHNPGDTFPYMATAKVKNQYVAFSERTAALAEEGLVVRALEVIHKQPDIIKTIEIDDPEDEDNKMQREEDEEREDEIAQENEELQSGHGQDYEDDED